MKTILVGFFFICVVLIYPKHGLASRQTEYGLGDVNRITSAIQNNIFKNIILKNIGHYRSISILFYCGKKDLFFEYKQTRVEVFELIMEEVGRIKKEGGENSKYLYSLSEAKMMILMTGTYNQLGIYNQGFIDSIRYHYRVKMMSHDNYCEAMLPVAVETLNQ